MLGGNGVCGGVCWTSDVWWCMRSRNFERSQPGVLALTALHSLVGPSGSSAASQKSMGSNGVMLTSNGYLGEDSSATAMWL